MSFLPPPPNPIYLFSFSVTPHPHPTQHTQCPKINTILMVVESVQGTFWAFFKVDKSLVGLGTLSRQKSPLTVNNTAKICSLPAFSQLEG